MFGQVSYDAKYAYYWDRPENDPTPETQVWTWEGPNNGVDYFSVDVYITDWADVELGVYDQIHFGIWYNGSTDWGTTTAEVVTSLEMPSPPALDCSNPASYTLSNLNDVEGASASWTIKQNGTTRSIGTGSTATASNLTNGAVDVEFTVDFTEDDLEELTFSEEYGFGIFNYTVVTGTAGVCPDTYYTYTAQVPGGHDDSYSYSWTYPSNWMWPQKIDNTIRLKTPLYNPEYGTVRASITNTCGTSGYTGITVYPGYCGNYYTMVPNPSTTYIDLDVDSQKTSALKELTENDISISIMDKMGIVVFSDKVTSLPYRVQLGKFHKGEYIATILTNSKTIASKDQRIESIKFIVE